MKREYAADTLKWNLTDLLTKEKDRATLDFLCECIDFLLKQPKPDAETGLVPCGCGGKAILFHQPDIEGPGSDGDRWAVFCEKTCGMETSDMTSPEYAVETWNTGMGYRNT